jgi:hypothetical protein
VLAVLSIALPVFALILIAAFCPGIAIPGLIVSALGLARPLVLEPFLTIIGGTATTPGALVATGMMVAESTERFRPLPAGRLVVLNLLVQSAVARVVA